VSELWLSDPHGGGESAKVRVARLGSRQYGVVARRQLRHLGLSARHIESLVASAYLHPIHRGVYAVGHSAPSPVAELVAALLYSGPNAMLSHSTAAWWLGLLTRPPKTIEVTTPRRCRSIKGVTVHDRRPLERTWHNDLPVAPIANVLLDVAGDLSGNRLRRVLAEAEYHGLLDLSSLKPALGRGHTGSAALRRALKRHEPRLAHTRSAFERRLLALCERFGLPLPEFNSTLHGYLIDALWREQKVIVEVDGRDGHQTWAQIQRDRERDLRLRAAGFLVLRYVWAQLTNDAAAVAADIDRALSWAARSAARGSR
jgi:very-short-patch-repair endonuclease